MTSEHLTAQELAEETGTTTPPLTLKGIPEPLTAFRLR
jgi:hypothetical protein